MRFLSNWLPPIIGSLIWFLFHFLSLSTIGIENESSFKDAVVLTTLLLLILLGLNAMIKLYKPGVVRSLYLIIGNLIISFGIIFLYELIQTKVFESEALLLINLNYPRYLIVALLFVILQTIVFYTWIRESIEERNEAEIRRIKEEELIRQAELNGLRQQFQPHFLFNSLNSIQSLLQFDKDKASEMIQTLADFLRGSVSKNPSSFRKLSEELKHLNLYLEIEMIRFEDRLLVEYQIDEKTLNEDIPSLILQPLVENSIKHGLYDTTGEITIKIEASLKNNFILIKISNPFESSNSTKKAGTGFGLSSVSRRLQLLFLRNDLLEIKSANKSFTVELKIPIKND